MNAPLFDPWQWIRDHADDADDAAPIEPTPALATLATLAAPGDWPSLPDEWRGGLARLRGADHPPHISKTVWARLVTDTLSIAENWAATAAALGWTAIDLFGVNPSAGARLDRDGMAVSLDGRKVVAITADAATIQTTSGGTLRHYRREKPGAVPVWRIVGRQR